MGKYYYIYHIYIFIQNTVYKTLCIQRDYTWYLFYLSVCRFGYQCAWQCIPMYTLNMRSQCVWMYDLNNHVRHAVAITIQYNDA